MSDPIGPGRARIDPIGPSGTLSVTSASAPVTAQEKKLKKTVDQLQGVFVEQLFKAMRDTVPEQEGIVTGGSGEEIFTGLLDQHLAAETPKHWEGGLSEALYRQLRQNLPTGNVPTFDTPTPDLPVR
jgi:flagellar protein FlgJ